MKRIKELPVTERPYEKCFEQGPEILSDCELLSIILRSGSPGINVYNLSAELLKNGIKKDSLLSIMHYTKEELIKQKGIGMVKAVQILAIRELVKRISSMSAESSLDFSSPESIADYYMERLRHLSMEQFMVIYLNTKCHMIKDLIISKGTINKTIISPREIFIQGLNCDAVSVILLHNHPSGDVTPSKDDIASTKRIIAAGKIVGISVLDHIIIGDKKYTSFKELNLI